jgi:hypothetical protein
MSAISDAIQKVRDSLSSLGKRGGGSSSEGSSGNKFTPKMAVTWVGSALRRWLHPSLTLLQR